MNLFGEASLLRGSRTINFLFRLSPEEKAFLREEAKRRGIRTTTLVRQCLREFLIASDKQ